MEQRSENGGSPAKTNIIIYPQNLRPMHIVPPSSSRTLCLLVVASLMGSLPTIAAPFTWSGAGGNGNLGNSANWNAGSPLPGTSNEWTFTGSLQPSVILNDQGGSSSWNTSGIVFDANADSFNLGGYASGTVGPISSNRFMLGATATIVQNSAAAQRISAQLYLASGTVSISGGGAGSLSLDAIRFHAGNGGTFQFFRSATIGAITSAATGSGVTQFSVKSPSTLTFAGADTGSLGRLVFESGSEIGNAIAATHADGVSLNAHLSTDRNLSFTGSRAIKVNNGFTLNGNQGKTLTFSSTGGTRFTQGVVQLGAAGGSGSRSIELAVNSGATAQFETEISGSVSTGSTAISKTGAGTLILSSANTFNGGVLLEGGTLLAQNSFGSATGSGAVTVTGGLLGGRGTIAPNGSAITIGNATVAVGTINDVALSGISTLTFGSQSIAGSTFTLGASSALRLDLWNANDYERFVFRLDTVDLANASLHLDSTFDAFALGQSYQIFDWGDADILQSFGALYLPTLESGLFWDTSELYTLGTVSVVAVPEPGSLALLVMALLASGFFRWRRISANAALVGASMITAFHPLQQAVATDALYTSPEEVAVEGQANHTIQFESGPLRADQELIVEFTAWYQGERPQGFIALMRVSLDGEELTDLLDRPATFMAKDERNRETRGPQGWRVPILLKPEEAANPAQPYFVHASEVADMTRFRFRLPHLKPGTHEISIENRVRTTSSGLVATILKVQDLRVVASPKEGTRE